MITEDVASKPKATKTFERNGWKLKLPKAPVVLEDARLLEYRHPAEHRMLVFALIATTSLVLAAVWFREKGVLLALAAIYASMLITAIQSKTYNRLQGAEVTSTQFPAIYQIVEELRQRFQAPATRVFVLHRFSFKVEVLGLMAPYVIILPSVLIDAIDLEESRYVLGQALGHVCFGHPRTALVLGGEGSELPAVLSWAAAVRDVIFAGYWRAEVMSSDRAGILACGDVSKAISAQVKVSIGSNQFREVRGEDLIEQAFKVGQGLNRLQATLIRWQSPTPPLIPRLEAMVEWAGLPSQPQK
jgi:hypothetical protein